MVRYGAGDQRRVVKANGSSEPKLIRARHRGECLVNKSYPQIGLGKICVVLHSRFSNGGLWILCAEMYGVGRGIPVCERYLGKHGATVAGLYPDMVARDREKQRPFVATDFLNE